MSDLIIRVLREYDIQQPDGVIAWEAGQSFSGSDHWKVQCGNTSYCLKRWPAAKPAMRTKRLIELVTPEIQRHGLPIATPLECRRGGRFVFEQDRWWDLTPWQVGAPVKNQPISRTRLENAMQWLASYHGLAGAQRIENGRSQALNYRYQLCQTLVDGLLSRLSQWDYDGLAPGLPELFVTYAQKSLPELASLLEQRVGLELTLLPVLADVWSDHVFFHGDEVSGVIDFGAMKMDSPCLDLARLLGSYAGFDATVIAEGIKYYCAVRDLDEKQIALVELFDRAHVVLAGVQWLIWLGPEQRIFKQMPQVNQHLQNLARRIDQ